MLGLLLVSLLGHQALAADCPTPYTIDGLLGDLTAAETGLRNRDDGATSEAGVRLRDGLGCLDEILPAPIAARAYRAVGAGLYSKGELDAANKWFRTSLELEPTWEYGVQDIPEGHPLRPDFDSLKTQIGGDPAEVEGKEFGDGSHYLDGRKITSPKARVERFHLYQVDGNGVASHVIEGNAFPATSLVSGAVAEVTDPTKPDKEKKPKKVRTNNEVSDKDLAKAEKEREKAAAKAAKDVKSKAKTRVDADGTVYYERVRPKEKTPLMIAGGAITAGAGVIYYASSRTRAKVFGITNACDVNPDVLPYEGDKCTVPADMPVCGRDQDPVADGCYKNPGAEVDRLAGVTNRLVVASLAVFAVGVGTTTWGIIVDGGTAVPTVNIRF